MFVFIYFSFEGTFLEIHATFIMNKHNLRSVQLVSELILVEIIPKLFLGHK